MRKKVQLYIEGKRADLDDASFLLLNYTQEDLSDPVVVRNSFSKQITLKGTPANDEIFGHLYRNDRNTLYGSPYTGPNFDPCRKTSFVLYNEANEIIESGYLKLDSIEQTQRKRAYKVTLYGGLGSFLYGISYKPDGEKMTLADLDYGVTLDFTINRQAVADAWARIGGDTSKSAKWDYINFVPCYSGLPSGEFNADKAVVYASSVGLPDAVGDFRTQSGWTLVTLPEKVTGNEAKDFRSYLQKPCFRMRAIIEALTGSLNNGGYTVNLDPEFFDDSNPYWNDTWLTLPKLQDLNIDDAGSSGTFTINFPGTYTIPGGGDVGSLYNVNMNLALVVPILTPQAGDWALDCVDIWSGGVGHYLNYYEIQVTVYDGLDAVIETLYFRISTAQPETGYNQMDAVVDYVDGTTGVMYKNGSPFLFPVSISEYGANKISVSVSQLQANWGTLQTPSYPNTIWPWGSSDAGTGVAIGSGSPVDVPNSNFSYNYVKSSTVRTGATITQAALLSGGNTPADYLLSYCKMFGLQLISHKDSKTVDIVLRKNFYNGGTVDINGRIDRGREITKRPFAFDARWYKWQTPMNGEWPEYYATKYGQTYGQYRVNTGYAFDATDKSVTDGIKFSGAAPVMETSKYFCDLMDGAQPIPSLFLGGGKFTLFKGGETTEADIPIPVSIQKTWYNPTYPMHDDWPKMQFHGKNNGSMDERDTLVFFGGMESPASGYVSLTDDVRVMLQLNGNAPCWLPQYCVYDYTCGVSSLPKFTRYIWTGGAVTKSLDWGDPIEAQMPGVTFTAGGNLFDQYWTKYIADRYDDDSVVLTAWVDLRGFQVNENLMRQFYAFDGAIWVLNRIIDHSLTTFGPTKCEFVKVQDKTNYTTY